MSLTDSAYSERYKKLRNSITYKILKSKREFHINIFNSVKNSNDMWKSFDNCPKY